MRTLFLLGILATLVVIAAKKPDQTAWEAARELAGMTATAISQSSDLIKESPPEPLPQEPIRETWKRISPTFAEDKPGVSTEAESPKPEIKQPIPSPAPRLASRSTKPETLKKTPPIPAAPSLDEWPKIPAMPVPPVQIQAIDTPVSAPPPVIAKPRAVARTNYADVKVYYENASRLLEEIK